MAIVVPNAERINRGWYVLDDLVSLCRNKNLTDMIILHEHRGQPDSLIIFHLPVGPTVYFGLQNESLDMILKKNYQICLKFTLT